MFEPMISFTGNVAAPPRLRTTPNGALVLDLRVATTPRIRRGDAWVDGGTLWYDVVCWNRLAQHVADSLKVGDPVVVHGRLLNRVWERPDLTTGEVLKTDKLTIDAQTVGVDLSRRVVAVVRPVQPRPEEAVSERAPYVPAGEAAEVPELDHDRLDELDELDEDAA